MTVDPGANLQPAVERWLAANGWEPGNRSAAGVLWFHGGAQAAIPDVIEAGSPTWHSVLKRLALAVRRSEQQVAAEIDRRLCERYALDAWHDFQLWLAMLPYDRALVLVDEAARYLGEYLDAHPAGKVSPEIPVPVNPDVAYTATGSPAGVGGSSEYRTESEEDW